MDALSEDPLVNTVTAYVKDYMSNYDASHSYDHIERVVAVAKRIYAESPAEPALDAKAILLSALLHDVGDRKYLKPGEDAATMVTTVLLAHGASPELAERVQTICLGVSYSSEVKDPARVKALIQTHPELAVVQDADRIDAIGAVGLGRMFTFGGAKTNRSMADTMDHLDEKLLRLESMIKTEAGRKIAKERTERLLLFKQWWKDETAGF
ncbi:HD domain-containing protein [Thozetella sp. PMI_491]|nr:HD domain-containing protein [Thozetella sp. PMI_491]